MTGPMGPGPNGSDAPPPAEAALAEPVFALVTASAGETRRAAEHLGQLLGGGEVLGLVGSLGTGKTCFVQGLARGLGVPPEAYVCSPTFALVAPHQGRLLLHHVDLYRLADAEEATFIGYEDLFETESVVAIEWFERFPELWPSAYLRLDFAEEAPGSTAPPVGAGAGGAPGADILEDEVEEATLRAPRWVTVTAVGARYLSLAERWRAALEGGSGDRGV